MNKVLHKRSSVITDGNPKLPSSEMLDYGELAINYADGAEVITLKNTSNEIVEFRSKNYFEDIINNNELVVSKALNELSEKVDNIEDDYKLADEAIKLELQGEIDATIQRLITNTNLSFYCIEPVSVTINEETTEYSANTLVNVLLKDTDVFTVTTTSDSSIQALYAWPKALDYFYPWLEGVSVFNGILFDMNSEDMYTKWNQGNQGIYHVQYAQYKNCVFWSDLGYISDVAKRTNYTLYNSSELPLCYSTIPDNTFKSFYFAYNVTSDPNWSNQAYKDSFAKATWATQAFSYYGLHSIGMFDIDSTRFNITLPKDCRGLMFSAPNILNAGVFDAINVTNFGSKQGSWRDAFAGCYQLQNLYIKNLKVSINVSWSPISQQSLAFILENAANTTNIVIYLSEYTYYRLTDVNKTTASEKNITLSLIATNTTDDNRLRMLQTTGDGNSYLANDGTYKAITIPDVDLSGYYTKQEIDNKGYLTQHQDISGKQDVISDLTTIRANAALGATALQTVPSEYITETELESKGYLTSVPSEYITETELNGKGYLTEEELSNVATSGSYNDLTDKPVIPSIDGLATVTYVNQEIGKIQNSSYDDTEIKKQLANKADKSELFSKSYNDLTDKPTIPAAVTESTVSGWGFTKNTGTYSKPSSGIPKSDLASAVQTSLGKADTALQSYTEQYQGTVEAVDTTESIDGVSNDFVTSEQLDARGYATTASVNNEINTINNTIGVNTAGFTLADRITKLEDGYDAPDARANVLWLGTSIPAGDISFSNNGTTQSTTTNLGSNNYPKMVADVLGFNLYNNSRGSSFVCFYPSSEDGTSSWANASDWTEYSSQVWKGYSLSASFAQVEEKFGPNGLNCPEWLVNNFKSYSYESLIIPYIDGTLASCDTVVIDHGYNDRSVIINEASWHPNENETQFAIGAGRDWLLQLQDPLDSSLVAETYFQGKWWNDESVSSKKHYMSAMIFLCKKIWNVNPNIKIVIGNYFAKKTNVFASDFGSDRLAEFVLLANSAIANWLVVPCIDVWNYTGLYNRNLTAGNDYQLFCPDNVHPHSDSTGRSNSIIAGVYINKLRGTLYKK